MTKEELLNLGFNSKILEYYDTEDGVIVWKKITVMAKFVKCHFGGNYGLGDEYLIYMDDKFYKFYYYGDLSANIVETTYN